MHLDWYGEQYTLWNNSVTSAKVDTKFLQSREIGTIFAIEKEEIC